MSLVITAGTVGTAIAGTLLLALGGFVLTLKPRSRTTIAFGVFCLALGTSFGPLNLVDLSLHPLVLAAYTVSDVAAAVSIAVLATSIPTPLSRRDHRKALVPAAVAGGFFAVAVLVAVTNVRAYAAFYAAGGFAATYHFWLFVDEQVILMALDATLLGGAALFALRHRDGSLGDVERAQCAVIGAAFVAMFGATVDLAAAADRSHPEDDVRLAGAFFLMLVAILWLLASARSTTGARGARNVALVALGVPLLVSVDHFPGLDGSVYGVIRVLVVLLLGYGVLRHRLLGIDLKVRWTISRGTVAAAFIAVFFLAGEGAQLVFGGENEWVGLIAAGALVFAVAPLQRAAERLAERAVPVTQPPPGDRRAPVTDAHAAYQRAVRLALRGRRLTPDEELELARLAEDLGIGAGTALLLRRDVEQESTEGGGGS